MTIFRFLGKQAYAPIFLAMQRFAAARSKQTQDEIWFLEHEPIYTQGMAGKPEHLLNPTQIPVIQVDRGGQITYHGPGQLVVYFLIDMERRQLQARTLVSLIEKALVELLQGFGVESYARADAPGIYVNHAKIASLGLRVRNKSSYHGLALNVDMDLAPFLNINPCGHIGMKMTQLCEFCPAISLTLAQEKLFSILQRYFS